MSDLQRVWARSKLGIQNGMLSEEDEEVGGDTLPELPEIVDDNSSSASSVSSTGTVIPSPNQNLFARPLGYESRLPRSVDDADSGAAFHEAAQ